MRKWTPGKHTHLFYSAIHFSVMEEIFKIWCISAKLILLYVWAIFITEQQLAMHEMSFYHHHLYYLDMETSEICPRNEHIVMLTDLSNSSVHARFLAFKTVKQNKSINIFWNWCLGAYVIMTPPLTSMSASANLSSLIYVQHLTKKISHICVLGHFMHLLLDRWQETGESKMDNDMCCNKGPRPHANRGYCLVCEAVHLVRAYKDLVICVKKI